MRVPTVTPQELQLIRDYNIDFYFTQQMPPHPKKFLSRQDEKDYQPLPGIHHCHVVDRATKQVYIDATGDDQDTARLAAFALVPTTTKPVPHAQARIAANLSGGTDIASALAAENASLKAQLAALSSAQTTPTKRKAGRPRKAAPVPDPQPVAAA